MIKLRRRLKINENCNYWRNWICRKRTDRVTVAKGHDVYILSRSKQGTEHGITYVQWLSENAHPEKQLEGIDAFVNLAGESINNGPWTEVQKQKSMTVGCKQRMNCSGY